MKLTFKRREIDDHVLKLTVGLVALGLPCLTRYLSGPSLGSISASYYEGGWATDFFVGCLFAISSFMFAYNGDSLAEMILSKTVALAGLGVALFPCGCGKGKADTTAHPIVHYTFAAIMFAALACLCIIFYWRAKAKGHREAKWRSYIYALCAATIILVILVLGIDGLTHGSIGAKVSDLTFWGELAGLLAFGISWLVASRVLPIITAPGERISILPVSA